MNEDDKTINWFKRHLKVIRTATVKLKPLEVAIFNLESKIHELKVVLNCTPCDSKLLQMQLQGRIATAFFQVRWIHQSLFISSHSLPSLLGSFCNCQLSVSWRMFHYMNKVNFIIISLKCMCFIDFTKPYYNNMYNVTQLCPSLPLSSSLASQILPAPMAANNGQHTKD